MRILLLLIMFLALGRQTLLAQEGNAGDSSVSKGISLAPSRLKPLYGTASYYADKFVGRETTNGEIYSHKKMTAACNRLPLGTWIRVTNTRNNRVVIVKVNDRLHPLNKRLVDLSHIAAERLGYIGSGLTQVKVEVLLKKRS